MRKIHRWIGLLIGIQLVLWMASGAVMSLLDANKVQGKEFRAPKVATAAWPAAAVPPDRVLAQARQPVLSISSGWLLDKPVYRLQSEKETVLVDALDERSVAVDAAVAQRVATASYRGPGAPGAAELVPRSLETRTHDAPVWRVPFSDDASTTVYVSQQGDVLWHRNWSWRVFDFFWMLHIMDYFERTDFNSPLIIATAVGGLWLSLSGVWLLGNSFRWSDFVPKALRKRRALSVFLPDGTRLRTVQVSAGDTVFAALAADGLQLPSNCGGGQSCGLCEVKVRNLAPPHATASDRAQLGAPKVAAGHRLACNLAVDGDLAIEVQGTAELWDEQRARVERVTALTPFLRELVLRPERKPGAAYHPGVYIQVHVPNYSIESRQIEFPEAQRTEWQALQVPPQLHNRAPLRRSYSMSTPTDEADGCITLLARFCHGAAGGKRHPPGRGSAYLYSLKAGDRVDFSGPFGDFAIRPGVRTKVFIGGGAGMAPLRAMVRSLVRGKVAAPIHFWYGARTLAEAPYVAEMQELARRHAGFDWQLVLSEAAVAGLATGLVHEVAQAGLSSRGIDLKQCDFYVCGPPLMLSATLKMLRRAGVADDRVAFDDFKL
ncbi:MAG: 2Fe-2S iron-sulfur cluster-binding protein [Rubrivivax sp.]